MSDVAEKDPCLRESIYRVNFIHAGGGDPLCIQYITSSRRTVRLGYTQGVYERFTIQKLIR